jgi:probable HAF family extracellular repeat protein
MLAVVLVTTLVSSPNVTAAEFLGLGDLSDGNYDSLALDVSSDGKVVVGRGRSELGDEAFRWTAQTGMVGLGAFSGGNSGSRAFGVSGDGSVVVGISDSAGGNEAFRWTAAAGMQPLRHPLQPQIRIFRAVDISRDGTVIVGGATIEGGGMRWTEEVGSVGLGPFEDAQIIDAISLDGRVIVGRSETAVEEIGQAYRWEESTGVVGLGDFPGGEFDSSASAVSRDGSIIVGSSTNEFGHEAFRWTAETGLVALGDLPGGSHHSHAFGVSGDGEIIVGISTSDLGIEGFIWTSADGMRRAHDVLVDDYGVDLTGWHIISVRDISEDGTIFVGQAINSDGFREGFVATIPEPSTLAMIITGLLVTAPLVRRRRDYGVRILNRSGW